MEEEQNFKVRPMKKWELAQMYKPEIQRKSAVDGLTDWINGCPDLLRELRATNYNPRSKVLTAVQVELITFYLGKP
jgi:hypothetical protein